jgi:hypothetical protein
MRFSLIWKKPGAAVAARPLIGCCVPLARLA